MLRLWLILFVMALCFFGILRFLAKPHIALQNTSYANIMQLPNSIETSHKTIAIYTPKRIHTHFTCLQVVLPTAYVMQQRNKQAKKLQVIKKGQKLCFNFPQTIPNTTLYITLKAIQDTWARVTIMGDSVLLSGYVSLHALQDGERLRPKDFAEYSSGGDLLLANAPKIESNNKELIIGDFSMQHILQIAQASLMAKDYELARAWLALAQQHNQAELAIYDIYATLLIHEKKQQEALELIQMVAEARKKIAQQ